MCMMSLQSNEETYQALFKRYSEKHRHYHTNEHIEACLKHFDNVCDLANHPEEIELALWFHDAIYDPYSQDNELASAKWAATFLKEHKVNRDVISRIYNMIITTCHDAPAQSNDQSLLIDIDLSILGSKPDTYYWFETAIRKEYQWVPLFLYRKKRKEVLDGFLAREKIYLTPYFYEKLEKQARKNLADAISKLR